MRSKSICVFVLLAPGWIAQALDVRAAEPGIYEVTIGVVHELKIGLRGKCHDSFCSGGGSHSVDDLQVGPELGVMLQIKPSDSDAIFSLPFLETFIPPVSGQIYVELTDELKRKIKEQAHEGGQCDDFETEELFLTSVLPREAQP